MLTSIPLKSRVHSPNGPSLKALIFDVDGTLADTEEIHRRAFNSAFQALAIGWHWSRQLYGELLAISGGRERIEHYAKRIGHPHKEGDELRHLATALHTEKTRCYARLLAEERVLLRPGVWRLLNEARQAGIRMAIATNTARSNVVALLDETLAGGAATWFEIIATADEVEPKKPSPAVYRRVLERLGLPAMACLAFEDTPNGNRSALACGIDTIITTHDYTETQDFLGAMLVLDHLGEPDRPFAALAGDPMGARFIDIDLLRRLHDRAVSTSVQPKITADGSTHPLLPNSKAMPLPSSR